MMVINSTMILFTILNYIFGNNGNIFHWLFTLTRYLAVFTDLWTLWLAFVAFNSYGHRAEVFNSWIGKPGVLYNATGTVLVEGLSSRNWIG